MLDLFLSACAVAGTVLLTFTSWLFARSLRGPLPLVAQFALREDSLALQSVPLAYLRQLTRYWAVLLACCALFSIARVAAWLPHWPRALSLLPALAMLSLLLIERHYRTRRFGQATVRPLPVQWATAAQVMQEHSRAVLTRSSSRLVMGSDPARLLLLDQHRCIRAAHFEHAAQQLAQRLPPGQRIVVACEDRALFILAVTACWHAARTVVLPSSDTRSALKGAAARHADGLISDCIELAEEATGKLINTAVSTASKPLPLLIIDADAWTVGPPVSAIAQSLSWPKKRSRLTRCHPAVVLYTSGSTGTPTAHTKTWGQLVAGAKTLTQLLQIDATASKPLLGATVSHSHMFGFEMVVMQVLQAGAAAYAPRLIFPADVAEFAALATAQSCAQWLVTTPFHLSVFARAGLSPQGLKRIVTATMPLSASLAQQVEQQAATEVHEIYGSTETGALAVRRTAQQQAWHLSRNVTLLLDQQGVAYVIGEQIHTVSDRRAARAQPADVYRAALRLHDVLQLVPGGFVLLGRDADTVKVAGKRASLQALTQTLRAVPGVIDACFVDASSLNATRLAAVVVAPGLTAALVRTALAQTIDAAFLPRPLRLVPALPRDANGKLNQAALLALLQPVAAKLELTTRWERAA